MKIEKGDELHENCGCVWEVLGVFKRNIRVRHKFDRDTFLWNKKQLQSFIKDPSRMLCKKASTLTH